MNSGLRIILLLIVAARCNGQIVKSLVYDFDGFDLAATALPEGDYSYGDLTYQVAPVNAGEYLGDRCLQLNLQWNANFGAFGRGISRYVELSQTQDRLNFFFLNPPSNNQSAEVVITVADDDNADNNYNTTYDDAWQKHVSIPSGSGWQLISVPLSQFTDGNSGGNGVFDIGFTGNRGMLLLVEFRFNRPVTAGNATFSIDMINFSDGAFPQGATITDLPPRAPGDHCYLGAHQFEAPGQVASIPTNFENMFPPVPGHKLRYVNTYIAWSANTSTTPSGLPGTAYQTLLNNGYRPVITWEPMFLGYAALDPKQPTLDQVINGMYDGYIDAFAAQVKNYTDTIIIRPMHEFDGDWYPWSISVNGQDPQKFISAFRHYVDRFRAAGATKVKWMWCPNSDYAPYRHWNWIVSAYPGDSYVDIVATDIYNAHYPASLPWWHSFRWLTTETYYYMTKYFPSKPYMIAELASRERKSTESPVSQTKAAWVADMDRQLQSSFSKTRGIIFFNENKDQDWRVNSSTDALNALRDHIWYDDYYFPAKTTSVSKGAYENSFRYYPSPARDIITISLEETDELSGIKIADLSGRICMYSKCTGKSTTLDLSAFEEGVYALTVTCTRGEYTRLMIRAHE